MIAVASAKNADDVEFKVTITMTLKEWKQLKNALPEKYPFYQLSCTISDFASNAESTFFPETKNK